MAASRLRSWVCAGNTLSKYKFSLDNGRLFSPSRLDLWKPLLSGTNLPSLTCVAGKKTVTEELGLPNPPKRPVSPYIKFVEDVRKDLSHLKHEEKNAEFIRRWEMLSETERLSYSNKFQQEFKDFKERAKEYYDKLTIEQIQDIKFLTFKNEMEKIVSSKMQKIKLEAESLGKPQHPGTVLNIFYKSINIPKDSKLTPLMYAVEKWNKLNEKEKKLYFLEYKKEYTTYKNKFLKWKQQMIESGRDDLFQKSVPLKYYPAKMFKVKPRPPVKKRKGVSS